MLIHNYRKERCCHVSGCFRVLNSKKNNEQVHAFKYRQHIKYFITGILLSCCLLSRGQDTTLAVIGSQGVPGEISMKELKAVFRGERQRWPDGTKVVIAMIKSTTPLGKLISEKIYSMSGDECVDLGRISFAGRFDPPKMYLIQQMK